MNDQTVDTWINWSDRRPPKEDLYWWRVGTVRVLGADVSPEWVEGLKSVGMGYGDPELWPRFSHWDGYHRTVPAGTQWKELGAGKKGDIDIPEIALKSCPFDGRKPRLYYSGRYIGASIIHAESISIECDCGRANLKYWRDLNKAVELWNART
jgi:hypothetical protein